MKKLLLLILLSKSALSFAQITVNSTHLPSAGQAWIEARDEFYNANITPGGASQTWNYTGLLTTVLDTSAFLSAASTPYASFFPASNLALNQTQDSTYLYATKSTTGMYLDGFYFYTAAAPFGQNAIPFSPSYKFIPTPFTYLDSQTSYYKYVIDIDSALPYIRIVHYVDVSFLCDGYGALQLPGNTYPNTLRVKQVETTYDSLLADTAGAGNYFSFGPPTIEQKTTYRWFKNAHPAVLLTLESDSTGVACNQSSYLFSSFTTSVAENPTTEPQVSVFPNPSTSIVHVRLPQEGTKADIFQLMDTQGKVIRETSLYGMKQYSFFVNNLSAGIYLWTVNSLSVSGKLVVE
jgi:hypothetical protein